jgi:hypothetical protein
VCQPVKADLLVVLKPTYDDAGGNADLAREVQNCRLRVIRARHEPRIGVWWYEVIRCESVRFDLLSVFCWLCEVYKDIASTMQQDVSCLVEE